MTDTEIAVRTLEAARLKALCDHDVEAVSILMHDDLIHVHVTGKVESKTEFINHLRSQPRHCERKTLTVRIYGSTAVLTGEVVNTLTRPGNTKSETVRMFVTQVAHNTPQGWQFVSFHACRL